MSLIDETYFVGDLNIPNTDKTEILERLMYFIKKHEPQLLQDILGYELYAPFVSETDEDASGSPATLSTRFDRLLNGCEYTGQDSRLHKWRGFRFTTGQGSVPQSLIANYIYWRWLKDQSTQTVGLGEVQTQGQNASLVSPIMKMNRAWNEMSRQIQELYYFLQSNLSDYPEWNSQYKLNMLKFFAPQNQFGI